MIERITRGDGFDRRGHEFSYHLAAGFTKRGDTVLDAACGTGYGSEFFGDQIRYVGVDRADALEYPFTGEYVPADLCSWEPDFGYDVFVSFGTIEHLDDYTNLIALAKRARRWVLLSTPVVPTKHINIYHLHDFESGDLARFMEDEQWQHFQTVQQPSEVSEISVFERIT
jgi:2-polyprenyl-3-methyl-5-hydroxy-6-metoxy-1,4-benzoquinol methylase